MSRTYRERYDKHYKLFKTKGGCYYCGLPEEVLDHAPPLAAIRDLGGPDELVKLGLKLLKVAACKECNAILHDVPIASLARRKLFVQEKMRKKYKKLLTMPKWTEQELQELSPQLRETVRRSLIARVVIQLRLIH